MSGSLGLNRTCVFGLKLGPEMIGGISKFVLSSSFLWHVLTYRRIRLDLVTLLSTPYCIRMQQH